MSNKEVLFKDKNEQWIFVLYISGGLTKLSMKAIENLNDICEAYLKCKYSIEIIDIEENPEIAIEQNIMASPTLIRALPEPIKRIINDLSKGENTLVALGIKKAAL